MTHHQLVVASPIPEMKRTINICRITFILIDLVVIIFEVRNGPTTRQIPPALSWCLENEVLPEDRETREIRR